MALEPVLIAGEWRQPANPTGSFKAIDPTAGKPLLESGHVPASLARAVDRRGGESASRASAWRALRAAFLWPDRFNRDDEGPEVATVNLAMRLVTVSAWIPGRRHSHWMRCPACERRRWCAIGWND